MEELVRGVVEGYKRAFARALAGEGGVDEVARHFAGGFVSANPARVRSGDIEGFKEMMALAFERYRSLGLRSKRLVGLRVTPIDEHHHVAHASWTYTYAPPGRDAVDIGIDIHYLVQVVGGQARIFGWTSQGEEPLLRRHGIIE